MVNKNLFPYDLAVVAILKCEAPYLKEWLDYHLLAGVDHFYLYDNDSPDNQAEVAAPYVEAGLIDYIHAPGNAMQLIVYNDAVKRFKFQCRYMAFIDGDEFILPKSNRSIVEVVDEILSRDSLAAGLAINWQIYGSNGQETADYSRGVLERFTRRAAKDWSGNKQVKTIANPRAIDFVGIPHYAIYFEPLTAVNENDAVVPAEFNEPVTAEKIVVNHYHCKSWEEYAQKSRRGYACANTEINQYTREKFNNLDRNDEFDNGILYYRAVRAENFSIESRDDRLARVIETLIKILPTVDNMETALTCRALATFLRSQFPAADYWKICEQASIEAILKSLSGATQSEAQLFIRDLPNLLSFPYPAVKFIRNAARDFLAQFMNVFGARYWWKHYVEFDYLRDLLKLESDNFVER